MGIFTPLSTVAGVNPAEIHDNPAISCENPAVFAINSGD
jgi:hypothetical protein